MYLIENFIITGDLNSGITESIMIFAKHAFCKSIKKVKDPRIRKTYLLIWMFFRLF